MYAGEAIHAPVLVFVHGGGLGAGDRAAVHALPEFARRNGMLLVSIEHRLTPEITARDCVDDVAAATAWVRRNADMHGGDPSRIFLLGVSSGSSLASLIAVAPEFLAAHGMRSSELAGVIALDNAAYDPAGLIETHPAEDPMRRLVEAAYGADAAALSTTRRVRRGGEYPPFLIFHADPGGDSERQSRDLAEALRGAGGVAEAVAAPGDDHRSILPGFGLDDDAEGVRAAAFIASN